MLPRDLRALGDGAGDGARGLAPLRAARTTRVLPRADLTRGLEREPTASRVHHESGEQPLSPRAGASGVELPASSADERGSQAPAAGSAAGGDHARQEGAAAVARA